ncbi:PH domain-containing protein [Amycolatopsis sp. K13G38]|uniref:PH domain-containing protein n=1 Tax=Amycolatopsis acididurans TaxID=2724524 RepID=A0ABX1J1S1_9PSEU|nr:PH domain-containing protein [Amycolatopsis acididurans]
MDNSAVSWAPRPALVALGWVGAALAAGGAVFSGSRMSVVLFSVAALALVLLSAHGTFVRPRLVADAEGLRVRALRGTLELRWPDTLTLLRSNKRFGRDSRTLEISSGDHLFVFGWVELGADPAEVMDELNRLR